MKTGLVEEDMVFIVVLLQQLTRLLRALFGEVEHLICSLVLDIKLDFPRGGHGRGGISGSSSDSSGSKSSSGGSRHSSVIVDSGPGESGRWLD